MSAPARELPARVAAALERLELRGAALLVAVSGGVDSCTLLHILHELSQESGLKLSVGHVNHGLRGVESQADAVFVEARSAQLGLPFASREVDPTALRDAPGVSRRERPTLQEAARALRYQALGAMAASAGAAAIATAHTLDDQAETVLLRMLRGSGPDGLGGIPESGLGPGATRLVRPFLDVQRAEIEAYAAAHALEWREDASNANRAYARNRLRRDWLPGLQRDFNPQLPRHLARLAEAQRADAQWIEQLVAREAQARWVAVGSGLELQRGGWRELPEALARRLVLRALREVGGGRDSSRMHMERILAFLRAGPEGEVGKVLELPGELRLERRRKCFWLAPVGPHPAC